MNDNILTPLLTERWSCTASYKTCQQPQPYSGYRSNWCSSCYLRVTSRLSATGRFARHGLCKRPATEGW